MAHAWNSLTHLDPRLVFFLEVVGASLWFVSKACSDFVERSWQNHYSSAYWFWRRWGCGTYVLGSLAVVLLLLNLREPAFIIAATIVGFVPMNLKNFVRSRRRLETGLGLGWVAVVTIGLGLVWSLWTYHGLATLTQKLEILATALLLASAYLFIRRASEYGYLAMMGISLAISMIYLTNGHLIFAVQQLTAAIIMVENYWMATGREPFIPLPQSLRRWVLHRSSRPS